MKPAFIITSAIKCKVGAFEPAARIIQTHETINNILKVFGPDTKIILVDGERTLQTQIHYMSTWKI